MSADNGKPYVRSASIYGPYLDGGTHADDIKCDPNTPGAFYVLCTIIRNGGPALCGTQTKGATIESAVAQMREGLKTLGVEWDEKYETN